MRILSVHPATTQLLFSLGAGNMLVGRTDLCTFPATALTLPSIGRPDQVSLDSIGAFAPELVFFGHGQLQGVTAGMMYNPQTLAETEQSIADVAQRLEKQVEAELVLHDLRTVTAQVKEKSAVYVPTKVHVLRENDLLSLFLVQDVLAAAGAEIVAADQAQMFFAIAADDKFLEKQIQEKEWQNLQAVQHERMFTLHPSLLYPTPQIVTGLKQLAKLLHGIEIV